MAAAAFDNTSRFDIGYWAGNWTNVTNYIPSPRDLALAGPRMFMKLGSLFAVPEAVDGIFGGIGQRVIPEATPHNLVNAATTATAMGGINDALPGAGQLPIDVDEQVAGLASRFTIEGARGLGSVFSYATSKWALCCIVMAVILNRTHIYASTRRNLSLPWKVRFAIRILPIALLAIQARWLLQSIQCQTSPDFSVLRWGNASKSSELMFTQNGGLLHTFSSTLLLGASDKDSCLAVHMIPPDDDDDDEIIDEVDSASISKPLIPDLSGSLSLLWPLFKTFCASQFIETLSCAVQGRPVATETGMTLFEHSLAFAEADSAVGAQLGWGTFGGTKPITRPLEKSGDSKDGRYIAITRSMIMNRVNTTPEVLLVAFLSAMNHLTSQILGIFNLQGRLRLVNTGFWGLAFMSFLVWSISTFSLDDLQNQSLLRFPTVCIIGFIPHVLVLFGIIICSLLYGTALVLAAISPPNGTEEPQNGAVDGSPQSRFIRRLTLAHQNMQANIPISSIRITMHMDFYTALLRTGFGIMTMASEAVYLNESRAVTVRQWTWLEEDRLREIEDAGSQWLGPGFRAQDAELNYSTGLTGSVGLVAAKDGLPGHLQNSSSGYAREMTTQKVTKLKSQDRGFRDGVGATERSGRWIMALEFFLGISRLLLRLWASLILAIMAKVGLRSRPGWLTRIASKPKSGERSDAGKAGTETAAMNSWFMGNDEEPSENIDIEDEMRKHLRDSEDDWNEENEEEQLDTSLYSWWLNGGWWGSNDSSGNFTLEPRDTDEDTTSVISYSTTEDRDWVSDDEYDGQKTPTQSSPQISRESTPFLDTPLSSADLARLLHPKTPDQRAEAEALAAHFASEGILTRSKYKVQHQRERARVLTSTRHRPENFMPSSPTGKLTPEEEAQILEFLIISRRSAQEPASSSSEPTSWAKGASGMGEGGPQCVVCQCAPRSIIVWPCRCLSLCDDCRVTLAMNNFDKCVCCRRDVASFSRIFVP
ncbi:ubiquitin-protein ligase-like protein [Xylogone sp. PMI_703]|nr:ubiquitin-protein ligase-like protein [Xylogone sp. PMI_703]